MRCILSYSTRYIYVGDARTETIQKTLNLYGQEKKEFGGGGTARKLFALSFSFFVQRQTDGLIHGFARSKESTRERSGELVC